MTFDLLRLNIDFKFEDYFGYFVNFNNAASNRKINSFLDEHKTFAKIILRDHSQNSDKYNTNVFIKMLSDLMQESTDLTEKRINKYCEIPFSEQLEVADKFLRLFNWTSLAEIVQILGITQVGQTVFVNTLSDSAAAFCSKSNIKIPLCAGHNIYLWDKVDFSDEGLELLAGLHNADLDQYKKELNECFRLNFLKYSSWLLMKNMMQNQIKAQKLNIEKTDDEKYAVVKWRPSDHYFR